jgi:hypothetical protein
MSTAPQPGELPTPRIDPPEPARPDELDTWSPGMTDESGTLPVDGGQVEHSAVADDAPSEPTA